MAKVGISRAAELTGKSKSTIQRALKDGRLSFEKDDRGRRTMDTSELDRVFGLESAKEESKETAQPSAELTLEIETLKLKNKMLEEQLDEAKAQILDLKAQRDQWQKQASQVLLTSQYTQDEAQKLRDELTRRKKEAYLRQKQMKERAEAQRAAKKKAMESRIKGIKADNENAQDDSVIEQRIPGQLAKFWGKLRGKDEQQTEAA